ncbi:MAG: GNAT family N-acetyltransferase [Sporolactobacillus sp.]
MIEISELKSEEDFHRVYPLMHQLRNLLSESDYLQLIKEAKQTQDYRLFALHVENQAISLVGFMPMITLYYGRFIWICDLVTDKAQRSRGYGRKLLDFVHEWCIEQGYSTIALSSGLQRKEAHRFYEMKAGYKRVSYVFKKTMENNV